MRLSRILGVLKRRWYVLVIGLLLSAGLGLLGVRISPPVYLAQGTILLLPSKEQLNAGGRNPFLHLDGLTGPAGIVIVRLDSDQNRAAIEAVSPTADYLVEPDPAMRGPGILVSVTDRTAEGALATLDFVLDTVTDTLREVQTERSVPSSATVGSMRLVVDVEPERQINGTLRMAVAGVGGGLVLTAAAMVAIDVLMLRRRTKRSRRPVGAEGEHDDAGQLASGLASRRSQILPRKSIKARRLVRTTSRPIAPPPVGRRTAPADQSVDAPPSRVAYPPLHQVRGSN